MVADIILLLLAANNLTEVQLSVVHGDTLRTSVDSNVRQRLLVPKVPSHVSQVQIKNLDKARHAVLARIRGKSQYNVYDAGAWGVVDRTQYRVCGVVQADGPGLPRTRYIAFKLDDGSKAFAAEWMAKCVRKVETVYQWPYYPLQRVSRFPVQYGQMERRLRAMQDLIAKDQGVLPSYITVARENFSVRPETQAVCGVFRHRNVTEDQHFAWYNGRLYHEGNVDAMEYIEEVLCKNNLNGEELTQLTLPEASNTEELTNGWIGTSNARHTVAWGAPGWFLRVDEQSLLGEGMNETPATESGTPPRVNPSTVVMSPALHQAAQLVRSLWPIPAPFDRDPELRVVFDIVVDHAGRLLQPPVYIFSRAEAGDAHGMQETIESAGRAIVKAGSFPELAGRGGRFRLVLRP